MSNLPTSWAICNLGDVIEMRTGPFGSALHKHDYVSNGIPVINPTHIKNACIEPDYSVSISEDKASALSEYKLYPNDVIMGRRGEMGRCAVVPDYANGWVCGTGSVILKTSAALDANYLQRYLSSPNTVRSLEGESVGSTMVNLNQKILLGLSIGIPPLQEQRRIADKLDTTLARVDTLNDRLARITPLLKRFRQSVLAAATSGRLTEDYANRSGPYPIFPLSKLADARLGKMLDKEKNTGEPVKYLRNVNVRWFSFVLDDLLEMRAEARDLEELSIENGDVLICEGGEPGRCAVWKMGNTKLIFQKALHRVRVNKSKLLPEWLVINLKNQADSGYLEKFFTGSTIKHLTGTSLAKVEIPLPSLDEQTEIVRRIETLFAFADRLEARLQSAQTAAERLTPALLAKAFRGELVPQDPNDEPAAELLRRLREARVVDTAAKPKSTRGRKLAT